MRSKVCVIQNTIHAHTVQISVDIECAITEYSNVKVHLDVPVLSTKEFK